MSQTRLQPSQRDPVKKLRLFSVHDNTCKIFSRSLLLCLLSSIAAVLYTTFRSPPTSLFQPKPEFDLGPTNISHVLFGLGGSTATWHDRSSYSAIWWAPNITRGFVWLDKNPENKNSSRPEKSAPPHKISSPQWTRFKFSSSRSAVRIARIISDSFKLGVPNVRWFVMGDDDTVYFPDNLVSVLAKYDHNQMWYIGGNSESVEQNMMHSFDMAFGGGGFAISYPLAERLVNLLDGCLDRYYYFYGSDQRIWACVSEIGVPLTREHGFHQLDIRANPYGFLAAHPLAPLVSLHHLEFLEPLFPNQNQIDSVKSLLQAYRADPPRILQQTFCHDYNRKWSISISWGYTIQLYPSLLPAKDLQAPTQTFKTWRTWSDGPFTFNTKPMQPDPCKQPVVFMLEQAQEVRKRGTLTSYKQDVPKPEKRCNATGYAQPLSIQRINVSCVKLDPDYWTKAPRRQCCELINRGSIKSSSMQIRIRKCRPWETVTT